MTVSEFWQGQQFSYLETYSFNRGPKLAAHRAAICEVIARIQRELPTARYMQNNKLLSQVERLTQELNVGIYHTRLMEADFKLTNTAEQVAVIKYGSAVMWQLTALLIASGPQVAFAGCLPIYRDALAFFDEHKQLVSVLNICFSCDQMVTHAGQQVQADTATFRALRSLLDGLGHPIHEDELLNNH